MTIQDWINIGVSIVAVIVASITACAVVRSARGQAFSELSNLQNKMELYEAKKILVQYIFKDHYQQNQESVITKYYSDRNKSDFRYLNADEQRKKLISFYKLVYDKQRSHLIRRKDAFRLIASREVSYVLLECLRPFEIAVRNGIGLDEEKFSLDYYPDPMFQWYEKNKDNFRN